MAVRQILTAAQPVLRKKARRVSEVTPALGKLIDDMIDTMRGAPGVGLAAPQVGVGQRVIVIEYAEDEEQEQEAAVEKPPAPRKLFVVINPELVRGLPVGAGLRRRGGTLRRGHGQGPQPPRVAHAPAR